MIYDIPILAARVPGGSTVTKNVRRVPFADLSFLHHIPVKWVPYFSVCICSKIFDEGRGLLDD